MAKKVLTLCLVLKDDPPSPEAPDGQSKILLGMKKSGFGMGKWNGFGGKVGEGETIEDATKRELLEESGLTCTRLEKVGVLSFSWSRSRSDRGSSYADVSASGQGSQEDVLEVHSFKAVDFSGEAMETEEMRPQWFLIKDVPFDTMWPEVKQWLPLYLENKTFEGRFVYDNDNNVVEYDLKETA